MMLGNFSAAATVAVRDLAIARKFYEETLGLTPTQDMPEGMGAIMYKTGSSELFVYESEFAGTNQATSVTWGVDDIDAVVNELKGKGITFEHYPDMGDGQEDIHVYEDTKSAWFKDPDGNIINLNSGS